ncbi:MAG: putative methyltransferase, partial [Candidatus Latescibacteria bacterium]|nr:putative methyltransferase [Candidatus Latescibacterota bacterium]
GKQGYISYGYRRPAESAEALGMLAEMGLAPVEVLPEFNHYVGAQVLAGVSQMIRTVSTGDASPVVQGEYRGALYTADKRARRKRGR